MGDDSASHAQVDYSLIPGFSALVDQMIAGAMKARAEGFGTGVSTDECLEHGLDLAEQPAQAQLAHLELVELMQTWIELHDLDAELAGLALVREVTVRATANGAAAPESVGREAEFERAIAARRTSGSVCFCDTCVAAGRDKVPSLTIDLDITASPELAEWAATATAIVVEWWPKVLASLGRMPYDKRIRLVVRPEVGPAAYWNGTEIHCDAGHFGEHEDFGCLVHEVVHVAQGYPSYDPGWLVEGIADYVRYCVMEPESRWATADLNGRSYTEGYGPCGVFLGWLCTRYDETLVHQLDAALRADAYTEQIVVDACGADFEALWPAFLASRAAAA